ncbi:hypothetical protein JXI42_07575 [bacterium]|nr:hypothetical protein [bacterium]
MKTREINKTLDWYMGGVAIIALVSMILKYGFIIPDSFSKLLYYVDIFIIASFMINSIIRVLVSPKKGEYIIKHKIQYILTFLFIFQIITFALFFSTPEYRAMLEKINLLSITKIYIILFQGYILFELLVQLGSIQSKISKFPLPPSVLLVSSFAAIILCGSLLLLLPNATVGGKMRFIDALFTATSATCVTGLIVVDTGTFFTSFGKTVIVILIQLGGLGLMTFATFFALIIRGQLGLRERMMLGDILNF